MEAAEEQIRPAITFMANTSELKFKIGTVIRMLHNRIYNKIIFSTENTKEGATDNLAGVAAVGADGEVDQDLDSVLLTRVGGRSSFVKRATAKK